MTRCRCGEPREAGHRCWATTEAELEALRPTAEVDELVHAFLDKWADTLNGGDRRHLHNDLDRLVAAVRAELRR